MYILPELALLPIPAILGKHTTTGPDPWYSDELNYLTGLITL